MNNALDFFIERMWLLLPAGIIIPIILLFGFVIYEISRVAKSRKKHRPEVVERGLRLKKLHKKPLFFSMAYLRKKNK